MASKPIKLKLFLDKEKNRVIFAEADKDFVDVLFSFLTLPVGTVVRRVSSKQRVLGCMNNLHISVTNLADGYFQNSACSDMLRYTRNGCANECSKLKVNIDDNGPIRYYMCSLGMHDKEHKHVSLSTIRNTLCSCGKEMWETVPLMDTNASSDDGVFVSGAAKFIVTDDLQVMHMTTGTLITLLSSLGIRDANGLEKKIISIGSEEVLRLLMYSLLGKEPLTYTLLERKDTLFGGSDEFQLISNPNAFKFEGIRLKFILRKSTNEVIYAEAREDFVNFLFSMLTMPLGSVSQLLDGTPSLECITNLYKSVRDLKVTPYLKSYDHLLYPRLAFQYGFKDNFFGIHEVHCPLYYYNYRPSRTGKCVTLTVNLSDPYVDKNWKAFSTSMYLVDPKLPLSGAENAQRYVKGPVMFMITDNLVVTPLCSISTITCLEQLNIPINDIEERVVSLGKDEALRVLGASMTSHKVLTTLFNHALAAKEPKQEES